MINIRENKRTIPFYRPVPLTDLPLLFHREHLFPYASYGETATVSRAVPESSRGQRARPRMGERRKG